jgi:hypothetical protein
MKIETVSLDEVVRSVVSGVAGLDLGLNDDGPAQGEERYIAELPLHGTVSGFLRIQVSLRLAQVLAGLMLHRKWDDETVTRDAMGELANIIAGNLRPLLGVCRGMGIPTVERRRSRRPGPAPVAVRAFACGLGHLEVEIFEGQEQPQAA